MLKKFAQDFILSLAQSSTQVVQMTFLAGSITFSQVAVDVSLSSDLSAYLPTDKPVHVTESFNQTGSGASSHGFLSSQTSFEFQASGNGFTWSNESFDDSELLAFDDQGPSTAPFLQSVDSSLVSPPLAASAQAFTSVDSSKPVISSSSFFEMVQKQNQRAPASSQQASFSSRLIQRTQEVIQAVVSTKAPDALNKDPAPAPTIVTAKIQGPIEISTQESTTTPAPSNPPSSNSSPTTTVPVAETEPPSPTTTVPVAETEPPSPTTTVPVAETEPPSPTTTAPVNDVSNPAEEVVAEPLEPLNPLPSTIQKKNVLVISDESQDAALRSWLSTLGEAQFEVHVIGRGESAPVSFDQFDLLILNLNRGLHSSDARALRGLTTPILTCQPNTGIELGFISVTDQSQPNNKKDIRITNISHSLFEGLDLPTQVSIFSQMVPVAFAERASENSTVLASWNSSSQSDRTLVFIDAGVRLSHGGVSGGPRGFYPCTNLARENYSSLGELLLRRSADFLMRSSAE